MINASLEQSKLAVEFTADARTVKEGKSVQFTPTVSGGFSPYSYEWNFGDGSTSTEAVPTHTYHKSGTFTVTLKITDDKGNTADSNKDGLHYRADRLERAAVSPEAPGTRWSGSSASWLPSSSGWGYSAPSG